MTAIHALTATELLARYRDGTLTPSEAFEAIAARIARWEPQIQALYAYDPDGAREAAAASTARWAAGAPLGPLDGVPVTVKENIATAGVPVPLGTAATSLAAAPHDAPAPARLREAGAIIFAKTTMPDYGMTSSGISSFHPITRNPWDLAKNPGGSSSGAGAAGAAGYGPLHVGTDIGGSVRLPAAWCGLVGLKPSLGRVPIDPPYVGRCAGPMTRTVADAALMMSVLSRPDPRDGMSLPPQDIAWDDLDLPLAGLRIGLQLDAGYGLPVEPLIAAAVEAAAVSFERAGAKIVPVGPLLTRTMIDGLDAFWRARAWADIEALEPERRARVLPYIYEWAKAGAAISGPDAVRGFNQTIAMRQAAARLFMDLDFLLSPTAPIAAFPANQSSPLEDPARPFEHIGFTVAWNMTEQPALSIPCGFLDHLPIGLQIVGRRFDDLGVLRLARAYEQARGPIANWPEPPAG